MPSFPAPLFRRIRRTLADVSTYADSGDHTLESIARDAKDLLTRTEEKRGPEKKLSEPTRKVKRAEKKKAHRESTKAIREAVMSRAGDYCELCTERFRPFDPPHLHHLVSGSGKRRQHQSEESCLAVHASCHDQWHKGRRDWPYKSTYAQRSIRIYVRDTSPQKTGEGTK